MYILRNANKKAKTYEGWHIGEPQEGDVAVESLDGWKEAPRPKTAGEIKAALLAVLGQVPDERVLEVHGLITSVNALLDLNRTTAAKLMLEQANGVDGMDTTAFLAVFNEGGV